MQNWYKLYLPVLLEHSTDPQADLKRADELVSRALAPDANYGLSHYFKGQLLRAGRRFDEAIAEFERALALDPSRTAVFEFLGVAYLEIGQYEKAIDFLRKSTLLSPRDQNLSCWYFKKSFAYFRFSKMTRRSNGPAGLSRSIRISRLARRPRSSACIDR